MFGVAWSLSSLENGRWVFPRLSRADDAMSADL